MDKMPADLETAFAQSALPAHLRAGATVYLLDPAKGYYVAHRGTNGFICLVSRTSWEWGKFRNDLFSPMGYDAEGARVIFPLERDVAVMRASGRFTAQQVKASIASGIRKGTYKATSPTGLCYMLEPIMRVYTGTPADQNIATVSMPHYMFYAPYTDPSDMGFDPDSTNGPFVRNPGSTVLGAHKGPWGLIIVRASDKEAAKIRESGKDLCRRLADYSPYFKTDAMAAMHH
jgi:hypothetical protein